MPIALRALFGVLIALIPAALVQGFLEQDMRIERRVQVGEEAMRLVRLIAEQQIRNIEGAQQILAAMAAHDALRDLQPSPACNAFLVRLVRSYPRYHTATLFDAQGNTLCSAQPEVRAFSVANRPYFQEVMRTGAFTVGEYAIGRNTGQRSLHLAAPLRLDDGTIGGVVVVALSLEWLIEDLRNIPLSAGSAAAIIDQNGVIIARSSEPDRYVGQQLQADLMPYITAERAGLIESYQVDGASRIGAYIPIVAPPRGLAIVLGMSTNVVIESEIARERRTAVLVVGSLLLTLVLAAAIFHLGVERPVNRLLAAAHSWSRREWSQRIGRIGGGREFERLAAAFDAMAAEVEKAEQDRLRGAVRMRALLEVSPQVVFTADAQGQVDGLNEFWHRLTGQRPQDGLGRGWLRAVHPDDRLPTMRAWQEALVEAGRGLAPEFNVELRVRRASDESWRWFVCRGAPIRDSDGTLLAWVGVALDYHDLRAAQDEAAEQAERLEVTYRNASVGMCLLNPRLEYLAVNQALSEVNGAAPEDHLGRRVEQMSSPALASRLVPHLRLALESGRAEESVEIEATDQANDRRVWLCSFHPLQGGAGVSLSMLDITARKLAEEAQHLLAREVDHRARNVLAVVRGLVRVSAAEAKYDSDQLVEVLESRIAALARVHTLLSREHWAGAPLAEVVEEELSAHDERLKASGPHVRLSAATAQPLALVLHELATNALKYGALSEPDGWVELRWEHEGEGLALYWKEHGGPPVMGPPPSSGFGTELIDANAGLPLDGHIERHWQRDGLLCVLHIGPRALMAQAA
ncbi:PAS domain S-box protein [Rhodovarius crocodyli]|uniref:histidine kinase n=1 Tax=Rhodovarius crocodyli TaxID=1979269 RepID=A0A437LX28_9PROT|nr:PAS domain-containing protein [Rhodovarius crocodyli]RVT89936.1 PAS domain S-box protein [Rhodovarius crocodyli]